MFTTKKSFMTVIAILLVVSLLAACGGNNNQGSTSSSSDSSSASSSASAPASAEPKEEVKLVFWNTGYPTIDTNNKTKTRDDFYIVQAIKRFEEANPHITIEMQDVPAGDEMFTKFQTASIANNGPDLGIFWNGNYMMRFKQFLEPMDSYFTEEERARLIGWESVSEDFKVGNTMYGVAQTSSGIYVLFYNKELFANAGLDPEQNPPQNFEEFMDMMQKLKDSGTSPLGIKSSGFWFVPSYWLSQTIGLEGMTNVINGTANFSDNAQLEAVMQGWQDMYQRGFVESDQLDNMFFNGQLAMIPAGSTYVINARKALGDKLGVMKVPNFNDNVLIRDGGIGGVGHAFAVTKYSKHKDEAVQFIKFVSSKEEQELRIKSGETMLSVANDVEITHEDPLLQQFAQWSNEPNVIFWPDNMYPADLSSEMVALQSLLISGKMTAKDYLTKIDEKRDEILKSSK